MFWYTFPMNTAPSADPDAARERTFELVLEALAAAPADLADGFDGNPDRRFAAIRRIARAIALHHARVHCETRRTD